MNIIFILIEFCYVDERGLDCQHLELIGKNVILRCSEWQLNEQAHNQLHTFTGHKLRFM